MMNTYENSEHIQYNKPKTDLILNGGKLKTLSL